MHKHVEGVMLEINHFQPNKTLLYIFQNYEMVFSYERYIFRTFLT